VPASESQKTPVLKSLSKKVKIFSADCSGVNLPWTFAVSEIAVLT
jgi:hypothetical protein